MSLSLMKTFQHIHIYIDIDIDIYIYVYIYIIYIYMAIVIKMAAIAKPIEGFAIFCCFNYYI